MPVTCTSSLFSMSSGRWLGPWLYKRQTFCLTRLSRAAPPHLVDPNSEKRPLFMTKAFTVERLPDVLLKAVATSPSGAFGASRHPRIARISGCIKQGVAIFYPWDRRLRAVVGGAGLGAAGRPASSCHRRRTKRRLELGDGARPNHVAAVAPRFRAGSCSSRPIPHRIRGRLNRAV